jgi:predicted GNAT superfamily acetyltransferase
MIGSASVATFIEPGQAFLLAFEQTNEYDGIHFKWFRSRYERFLYVGRVDNGACSHTARWSLRAGLSGALGEYDMQDVLERMESSQYLGAAEPEDEAARKQLA